METEGIAIRLKQLINFLDLSDSQFADKCGISRATLSLLLSGKNKKISDIILSQIHEAFPNVNIMWLLFKEGSITKSVSDSSPTLEFESQYNIYSSPENKNLLDQPQTDLFSGQFDNDNENQLSQDNSKESGNKSNLIGFNIIEKQIQDAVSKGFERYFKNYLHNSDSGELPEKTKKIRQITVYYDDSTFETFSPGR